MSWSTTAHWFCHKRFNEAVIWQPASAKDRMFGWNSLKMNSFQLLSFSLILLHSIWSGVKCTIEHLIIVIIFIIIVIQAHKCTHLNCSSHWGSCWHSFSFSLFFFIFCYCFFFFGTCFVWIVSSGLCLTGCLCAIKELWTYDESSAQAAVLNYAELD